MEEVAPVQPESRVRSFPSWVETWWRGVVVQADPVGGVGWWWEFGLLDILTAGVNSCEGLDW